MKKENCLQRDVRLTSQEVSEVLVKKTRASCSGPGGSIAS